MVRKEFPFAKCNWGGSTPLSPTTPSRPALAEVEEGEEDGTFVQREGSDSGEEGSMIVLSDGDAALESPQAKHATGQRGSFTQATANEAFLI